MAPKISARFRRKNGVPFSIERLSGMQYRCRICNVLYYSEKEISQHLKKHEKVREKRDNHVPQLDHLVSTKVLYTMDLYDRSRAKYLKLSDGEELDEP
ncbi:MAG: hypothetical protein GXO75_20875 [Calditrichaeota bacterium]|nr:hypothetical protein [Calditrichota bacterium]